MPANEKTNSAILVATVVISAWLLRAVPATAQVEREATATLAGEISIIGADGTTVVDRSDAIVFLDGSISNATEDADADVMAISQRGRRYSPRVAAVVRGTTLRFLNDDDIFHNTFSLSPAAPFDLGIYAQGEHKDVTAKAAGLVKVYCNIHPDMVSNVLVLNNPWFARTGADGSFEITDVPPGRYTLRVWHELGGAHQQAVTLSPGARLVESPVIRNTVATRSHKNKFGKPYRSKY